MLRIKYAYQKRVSVELLFSEKVQEHRDGVMNFAVVTMMNEVGVSCVL